MVGAARAALLRPATPAPPPLRRARLATLFAFVSAGALFGAWAPRIPELKDHLGLSAGALAVALLAPALGSLLSLTIAGRLAARYGSARATTALAAYMLAVGWLPGLAGGLPALCALMFVWGLGMGSMDVAMNAQAVTVEKAYRRPIMSAFHACWSLASLGGAVVGSIGAAQDWPIARQQFVVSLVLLAVLAVVHRWYLPDPVGRDAAPEAGRREPAGLRLLLDRRLALLGLAAMGAMLAEGSVADWSGVYLKEDLHAQAAHVGLAYGAFMALQTVGRLVGDRVVHVYGRRRSIAVVAAIGSLGLSLGLATQTVAGTVAGFALLGIGVSIGVPVAFSAAADGRAHAGPAIAAVSSLAYTAFLAGPTLIGVLAQTTSVPVALWVVPVVTALSGVAFLAALRHPPALRRGVSTDTDAATV